MDNTTQAKYKSLKVFPGGLAEALAETELILDKKRGTFQIEGLNTKSFGSMELSADQVEMGVESIIDPTLLQEAIPKGTKVALTTEQGVIEGNLQSDYRYGNGERLVVKRSDNGRLEVFPERSSFSRISINEDLQTEPTIQAWYAKENSQSEQKKVTITHFVQGLNLSGIVYDLSLGEKELQIRPHVKINNNSSYHYQEVKLAVILPQSPDSEGDKITPEVTPFEEGRKRSEQILKKNPSRNMSACRRTPANMLYDMAPAGAALPPGAGAEGLNYLEEMVVEEVGFADLEETLEGSLVKVDTAGKYSLALKESKRIPLQEKTADNYHQAKVLLLNPAFYQEGMHYTSIIDTVRFVSPANFKAGSFYADGNQLQFPEMVSGQEYELGLRTCHNLEATVALGVRQEQDARGGRTTTPVYKVTLINNTPEEQKVEVNIPLESIRKMGELSGDLNYETKEIVGEKYHVASVSVGAKSKTEFQFEIKR